MDDLILLLERSLILANDGRRGIPRVRISRAEDAIVRHVLTIFEHRSAPSSDEGAAVSTSDPCPSKVG